MSSGMGSAERARDFQARVDAYEAERMKTSSGRGAPKTKKAKQAKARAEAPQERQGVLASLIKYPLAVVIGAGSVLAGQVLAFHYATEYPEVAVQYLGDHLWWAGDLVIAIPLAFILTWIVRLKGMQKNVELIAFVAMIWFEFELMMAYPDIWSQLYTPEFVAEQLAYAEAEAFYY